MLQVILTILFLLQSQLIVSVYCSPIIPDQLYCSTTLSLANKDFYAPTDPAPFHHVDLYQVEEFVDMNTRRSSVSITDIVKSKTEIYYNQVGPRESSERSFSFYDPMNGDCKDELIGSWPLASLRFIAINLHNSIADMKREHVDVAIGPSSLLYSIENNLSGFGFKTRMFSDSRMTMVDVFTKEIKYDTFNGMEKVNIIVHLMTRGRDSPKEGDTLKSVCDEEASLDIALIGACKTGSSDSLESQSDVKEKGKEDGQQKRPVDLQLDQDTFCEPNKLIFSIQYNLVSLYKPGTLVGKSLDDFGQDAGYDFEMEPFVTPVGIGCLGSFVTYRPSWQKSLSRGGLTGRFSGEFVSSNGRKGISYVAYDSKKQLLRLDQAGRKSVYRFFAATSYHVGEFPPQVSEQTMKRDQGEWGDDKAVPQCIVLNMTESTSSIRANEDIGRQVIGLRRDGNERYLGSRMLDHVNYEVFEIEWEDRLKLPIVLAAVGYPLMKPMNKRVYIDYYAKSIAFNQLSSRLPDQRIETEPLELSFIEVWEFDTLHKKKVLVNRIKFLEFSWLLDVEPADDPQSQRPGPVDRRVFELEPCHQDRAAQAELVVKFKKVPDDPMRSSRQWLHGLDETEHLVSYIDSYLASSMGVSILNLVDTKANVFDSGDVLAATKVVELRTGISTAHSLGLFIYKLGSKAEGVDKTVPNRHSFEECRLESINAPTSNWFAYCPNLALCLILNENDWGKSGLVDWFEANDLREKQEKERSSSENGINWDICAAESFTYKTVDVSHKSSFDSSALEKAFRFFTQGKEGNWRKRFELKSTYEVETIALKQLDSIGTRLTNDVTLLSNLRYSTKDEEPSSINMNTRVTAQTKMGAFRFCQLACQMDDFCSSFSMCSRPTIDGMEQADCVLSTVRLTGERLNNIMSILAQNKQAEKFQMKITGESYSQVLIMRRENLCSLHPKDFLAEYQVTKTWKMQQKHPLELDSADQAKKKNGLQKRYLDLEDCAALNYELDLFNDPVSSNFAYCPLNSHCIVSGDDYSGQMEDTSEYCYIYRRHPTRAYEVKQMTHLVATKLAVDSSGQPLSAIDQEATKQAKSLAEKLDLLEKYAKSGTKQLATMSWGSSEQKCARDCNMHKSKCLAFDSCRNEGKVLCILYSRRSPMMKESAHFPLLKQERDNSLEYSVELRESNICDHYYLKEDYFAVRLNAMLEDEKKGFIVDQNDERQQAINELEEEIDEQNTKQNDEIVDSLIGDVQHLAEVELKADRRGPSDNQLIHLMSLLFGLVLGAVGILYHQQILEGISEIRQKYRERRAHANDGLKDLVLNTQDV